MCVTVAELTRFRIELIPIIAIDLHFESNSKYLDREIFEMNSDKIVQLMKPHKLFLSYFYSMVSLNFIVVLFFSFDLLRWVAFFMVLTVIVWAFVLIEMKCPVCKAMKYENYFEVLVPWSAFKQLRFLRWEYKCPHCGSD